MKWKTLSQEQLFKIAFVTIDKEVCELPDGRVMPSYYVLHFNDWVNVVPIDKDGNFILIKQYRQASKEVHWEIPGGGMNKQESPEVSARRELREETGYDCDQLEFISMHYPNPATQDNKIYTYLARNCEYKGPQELDEFEEIEVHTLSRNQVEEMLLRGEFNHTICVASLFQALLFLDK